MYGLMRAGVCSTNREKAYQRRLHYCGTCKTIGRMYGQRSRMLLNNDAVFLAELLTALSPDAPPLREWNRSFQSHSCLALPKDEAQSPMALQVAAAATVVMSEFKVADQLDDGGGSKWRLAQRVYSQAFTEASRRMKDWGFPVAEMWQRYQMQRPRETEVSCGDAARGVLQTVQYVAEPTAAVTGAVFAHGARVVGAAKPVQETMDRIGFAFGELVFVLDALEDYGKDVKRGDFNALRAAFRITEVEHPGQPLAALPPNARATTEAYLWEIAGRVIGAIDALPISRALARLFVQRLKTNLERRLGPEPRSRMSVGAVVRRLVSRAWQAIAVRRPQLAGAGGSGAIPGYLSEGADGNTGTEVATTDGDGDGAVPAKTGGGGGGCGGCGGCDSCDGCCCCVEGCGDGCDICSSCGDCCSGCDCSACGDCCSGCGSCIF